MNKIIEDLIKTRQGHYCHALEVNDIYELQAIIDQCIDNFLPEYTLKDIIDFFKSIELYCLNDINEDEVYNFNITEYILNL